MADGVERRLDKIESKLDGIVVAVGKIAVQDERINGIDTKVDGLWKKWDEQAVPHINQCPRTQVKWMWGIVVPMGLTLLAIAITLVN